MSGHVEGDGEEPESEAVRRAGRGPRHDQAVLPRRRQRAEEDVSRQERRAAVAAIRALALHADDRLAHQDVRTVADVAG